MQPSEKTDYAPLARHYAQHRKPHPVVLARLREQVSPESRVRRYPSLETLRKEMAEQGFGLTSRYEAETLKPRCDIVPCGGRADAGALRTDPLRGRSQVEPVPRFSVRSSQAGTAAALAPTMQLGQLSSFVITASLVCACATPRQTARQTTPLIDASPEDGEYKVITPDVSTYPPRAPVRPAQPPDENEDIMAGILSIPPGQ